MYPWSKHPAPAPASADSGQAGRPAPTRATEAVQAVQVALDRRDNGGDAAAEPTASRARQ
jgi:hypothetical protein